MGLDLRAIGIMGAAAVVYGLLRSPRARRWFLLGGSVLAIFWLQPPVPIRFSGFIFPTATLALAILGWWLTRAAEDPAQQATTGEDRRTLLLLVGLVLMISLVRYLPLEWRPLANRPPSVVLVAGVLLAAAVPGALLAAAGRRLNRTRLLLAGAVLLVLLFILLKAEPLATIVSQWWRAGTGQDQTLAGIVDLEWLGFSYVAFRLLHTLRERHFGRLPILSLREYVTYVIFAPAFVAGPIDRAERFTPDLRDGLSSRWTPGVERIAIGLGKKFVIADSLALGLSLNATTAVQASSVAGLWLLLYGYGLRLYFDFSGYTDIAIGLGHLFGIRLPENFRRPYLATSLTSFWQRWHITLSDWVRTYVFTPVSRYFLRLRRRPSPTLIVLVAQLATMIIIGLWHGIALHFFIWGVWHGVGLFVHKQWADRTRRRYREVQQYRWRRRGWAFAAWVITFHYVMLGWVWFVVPDSGLALRTVGRLLGVGW